MRANVTRAADGLERRSFTVEEVLAMEKAGIIAEDENYELVEGEIVPIQAKSHAHELIKSALNLGLARALPEHLWLGVESSMYLSANTLLEPDLVIYPKGIRLEAVKGSDIVLAIEVALTTLAYDRGLKAQIYAHYGVRELWVIDAERRRTYVHRNSANGVWRDLESLEPDAILRCSEVPGFAVNLSEI